MKLLNRSIMVHLSISESSILLSSDQHIDSRIFVDIEFRKLRLNSRIFINRGKPRRLNCVADLM